jgi:hypothetical protein
LLIVAGEIGTVRTEAATAAVATTATMHAETILVAVALIVTVLRWVLLRLATAACDERRQAAYFLPAFLPALVWLLIRGLWLMLRTVVYLLVARRKGLRIAWQIRLRRRLLLLRFTRRVTRLVLAHERLAVVIVAIETVVSPLLLATRRALLGLLVVVRILLAELFLRRGDKTEIMFGVLIVIFGGHWITGSLRIAR